MALQVNLNADWWNNVHLCTLCTSYTFFNLAALLKGKKWMSSSSVLAIIYCTMEL